MRKKKMMKRVVTGIMVAVILVSGVVVLPKEANAAETTGLSEIPTADDKVLPVQVSVADFNTFYGETEKIAPTKEGYLFGGWYLDETLTNAIKSKTDVQEKETVYAKFVPAYVLSVKAQNYASTEPTDGAATETNQTTTRVISTVDNLSYQEVGFEVHIEGKEAVVVNTTKVWEKLAVGKNGDANYTEYGTDPVFGKASTYFFVLNVNKIPETKWDEAIYVRPYWITEDGTKVEGLSKYVYTEDGIKKYISVPINLNNMTEGVAAGVLKVSYDDSKMDFVESVVGKVFGEMEINPQTGVVTCVGNVDTLTDTTENDMYITLRFSVKDTEKPLAQRVVDDQTDETYKFAVSAENFASIKEVAVTINVWDVQY